MQDKEFLNFINTTTTKGASTYNLKTQNCSKMAREILSQTQYKALAKQHISGNIVQAYNNNQEFKDKLNEVMAQYNIVVIA